MWLQIQIYGFLDAQNDDENFLPIMEKRRSAGNSNLTFFTYQSFSVNNRGVNGIEKGKYKSTSIVLFTSWVQPSLTLESVDFVLLLARLYGKCLISFRIRIEQIESNISKT